MRTREELKQLQTMPLEVKIKKTQQRIYEWVDTYGVDGVYVSFSGGKDSTVLLDIARGAYPGVEAVFVDTGLEYPEIKEFVKSFENTKIIRPKKNFKKVLTDYGYPVVSKEIAKRVKEARAAIKDGRTENYAVKELQGRAISKDGEKSIFNKEKWGFLLDAPFRISHMCCDVTKKNPLHKFYKEFQKVPITGQMAEESRLRYAQWIQYGCNMYDKGIPQSNPISFWTGNDILQYIREHELKIASIYGSVVVNDPDQIIGQVNVNDWLCDYRECSFRTTGIDRTGCMFCLFGAHLGKEMGRLERMKKIHPKRYEYVMGGGEFGPDGMWIPNNEGLGFKFVVDWLNERGSLNIRY